MGEHINDTKCNHISYADDLSLISVYSAATQTLLNICEECGNEQDLIYNNKKKLIAIL